MSISTLERAGAALQEEVHRQWRDWTRYLEAHITLLDARAAERRVAFERDELLDEQARQAQAVLTGLPQARRTLFDQLREERRQVVQAEREAKQPQGRPPDPDVVERQALAALLAEATGTHEPNGWGVVPLREGAGVTWYDVNVAALREAPGAASYALGNQDSDQMRTRMLLAAALATAGVLFLLIWFLWPRGGATASVAEQPLGLINRTPLAPWMPQAIIATGADGEALRLPVTTGEPGNNESSAGWFTEHLVPLRLCLPADVLADIAEVTLLGDGAQPDRVYRLSAAGATPRPDLLLEPCGGAAPSRAATFQQLRRPGFAALGETQPLNADLPVTLTTISIIGPGSDPTLPSGQARVTVDVQAAITDWAGYAPTLLLADGRSRLPVEAPELHDDGATLRYLVPLPTSTRDVVWSLRDPVSGHIRRWRSSLAPPPNRTTVLRHTLDVQAVVPRLRDGTLTLRVTLHNRGAQPLHLSPDDIQLAGITGNAMPLAVPEPAAFAEPLTPSASRQLTLTAALSSSSMDALTLTIGAQRFRIRTAE